MKYIGKQVVKKRRYEALQRLVDSSDYFNEEIMQRRNPILYDQLIGRFHSKSEREAFLQLSNRSRNCSAYGGPLVDLFMAHMDRNEDGSSVRREGQEAQQQAEDDADEEYYEENMDEDDSDYFSGKSKENGSSKMWNSPPEQEQEGCEEIEEDEKELFKEEFFTTMYSHFLEGKDLDFDYSTVDDNSDYDCGETMVQDMEDKYFDDEEPCTAQESANQIDDSENDSFKYPKTYTGIEANLGKCDLQEVASSSKNTHSKIEVSNSANNSESDEDELDAYMKSIQTQLGRKS